MICNCSMAGTMACQTCPTKQWEHEGRLQSKVLFAYNVDVVEVVRCRDCKHWWPSEEICDRKRTITSGSWFCADGERRD